METFDKAYSYEFPDNAAGDKEEAISPVGIDSAELLEKAPPATLLARHLELERTSTKAFWECSFIEFKLWTTGSYRDMMPEPKEGKTVSVRSEAYPWTRDGFLDFLHDHGSHLSPDEVSRRMKVFKTYNRFTVTTIRMIERIGVNKAYLAIPYVKPVNVNEMLERCAETPYSELRGVLDAEYGREPGRGRNTKTKEQRQRDDETRAARTIQTCGGMLGEPAVFIPRQYRQEIAEERYAQAVFEMAQSKSGINDRDVFFMAVVKLVADHFLDEKDVESINRRIAAAKAGDTAQKLRSAA